MKKLTTSILFLLIIGLIPTISHSQSVANPQIKVTISDGTTTFTPTSTNKPAAFILAKFSPAPTGTGDVTDDSFKILNCSTRPCTVFFPSGRVASSTAACQTGETFKLQDTNTAGALVRKFDSGGTGGFDAIQLRNFRAIPCGSSGTVRTLTLTRETTLDTSGNSVFRALNGGTYSFSASVVGTFRKGAISGSTTTANASRCAVTSPPCVKLEIVVRPGLSDQNTVNGSLTDSSGTATLTVNSSNISKLSTGVTDTEGPPTTASGIPCGTAGVAGSCKVTLKATLTVVAGITTSSTGVVQHDVFACTSCTAAMANATDEDGGWAALLTGLTGPEEGLANIFVAYTSELQPYKFTPRPPWTNQTRNVSNSSTIPVPFAVEKAVLEPLAANESFTLLSIGSDNGVPDVPLAEQLLNDGARVTYFPITNLVQWKNVTSIKYFYDVVVDSSFVDGSNGALRAEITLFDVKTKQTKGKIVCFLGGPLEEPPFRSGFDAEAGLLNGANLVADAQQRCDATGVGGQAETSIGATQKGSTGNLGVLQIAFVLDRGEAPLTVDQRADFIRAEIKENNDTFTSQGQLLVVDHFEPTCDLELDGRTMRVTNLERDFLEPTDPTSPRVKEIPNAEIENNSCEYRAKRNISFFEPVPNEPNSYTVEMCINGRCFPDAGTLSLL